MDSSTIYLVMQADSVITCAAFISFLTGIAFLVSLIGKIAMETVISTNSYENKDDEEWLCMWKNVLKITTPVFVVSLLIATLVPSSKTMATMYVIPAIANSETVQDEASEIYQLAKEALRDMSPKELKE